MSEQIQRVIMDILSILISILLYAAALGGLTWISFQLSEDESFRALVYGLEASALGIRILDVFNERPWW